MANNLLKKTNTKSLPGGRTGGLVSLFINDTDQLLASAFGKTCCLDLFTGAHRWTNNMDVGSICIEFDADLENKY